MRKTVFAIAMLALATGLHAQAQSSSHGGIRYRWRDGSGLPHYSDSLSSDALKYGYDLVNDRGLVIQHVDRQLTPEERAAAQQLADQQAAQQHAAAERTRTDSQMLAAYPTEDAYKDSQQQSLGNIDQQINTTRVNLRSQEKALADLLTRAGDLERAKQPVPKSLNDGISKQRNIVAGQRNTLERQQNARDAAEQKNAQDLQHYREVKAAHDKPQG
ncbi:DUF4124 domain-containing protein [Dyella halodurans]|uniref:DUF4124 domain-containing protein n=1 Tax=Dyella halodurans TaxID=1920171 RepID=A0ABV9BXT4_9GAMM|nr:DUF4124 domain-containing protein [Dyella halodurans]